MPIIIALVATMASRRQWRDKWSVCHMAALQLTFEIYKFRMMCLEYDVANLPRPTSQQVDEAPPPLTTKE